jgi:hypothetical protein
LERRLGVQLAQVGEPNVHQRPGRLPGPGREQVKSQQALYALIWEMHREFDHIIPMA